MKVLLAPSLEAGVVQKALRRDRERLLDARIICPAVRPEDRQEGLRIHKLYVMASALKVEGGWATYHHLHRSLLLTSLAPGVDTEVVLL